MAKNSKPTEVELVPDAWPRFERFIKQIAKAPPQHRAAKKKKIAAKTNRRKEAKDERAK